MASIKTITRFSQAPEFPGGDIPDTALVLVEVNSKVYKLSFAALMAAAVAAVEAEAEAE